MKHFAALSAALILTGCTLTPDKEPQTQSDNYQPAVELTNEDCVFESDAQLDPARCDLSFWLDYWAQVDQMTWPKRESLIEQLGDAPDMLLQKVILSQPVNTKKKNSCTRPTKPDCALSTGLNNCCRRYRQPISSA